MANIEGSITINEIAVIEVDADPSSGTAAPIGSIASVDNGSGVYLKFGSGDTDWIRLSTTVTTITYGTPVTVGTVNAAGVATTLARSDHVHAHGDQTVGTLHAIATTVVPGFMSAADKTKLDALPASVLTNIAPVNVDKSAAVVGVSTTAARADHKHDTNTAAPTVNLTPTTTNAEGTATTLARSDHSHALPTAAPIANLSATTTNATGTGASFSRNDHSHAITANVAPSNVGTVNTVGTSAAIARADHVHNHGAQTDGTHHAVATISVNGFMSAVDKIKLNALVTKAGRIAAVTFTGNPKKATVTFTTPFISTNYSIRVSGSDGRSWIVESKLVGSFVINSQANAALTGEVSWQAQLDGEVG